MTPTVSPAMMSARTLLHDISRHQDKSGTLRHTVRPRRDWASRNVVEMEDLVEASDTGICFSVQANILRACAIGFDFRPCSCRICAACCDRCSESNTISTGSVASSPTTSAPDLVDLQGPSCPTAAACMPDAIAAQSQSLFHCTLAVQQKR
mmetsp:Transcript_54430/g.112316  ORF Transcript_54430/g.112316 Transcript_54430/m.112316 type:complete len:151 (-) Transcript_54430:44-496(-)